LPTYIVWAIWLGLGMQWLLDWVNISGLDSRIWTTRLMQGIMAFGVVAAIFYTGPKVDLSNDWSTRIQGEAILHAVEPNALVLGWWDTVPAIQYLQFVEGQRLDVQAINRFLISYDDLTVLVKNEVANRPVYINELPLSWQDTFDVQKAGPLYRILLSDDEDKHVIQPEAK